MITELLMIIASLCQVAAGKDTKLSEVYAYQLTCQQRYIGCLKTKGSFDGMKLLDCIAEMK